MDANVKLRDDVDPHAVAGDERLVAPARDFEPKRVHIDGDHVVHDRQYESTTVEHDFLTAHARAYERALLARAEIEPVEQCDDDRDDDRDHNEP